jgi:hypothetical protein
MTGAPVTHVAFTPAGADDRSRGLLGWVECSLGGLLRLDGIAVRRTLEGRITLAYPARKSSGGARHHYFRPLDDRARRELEVAILGELSASTEPLR